MKKKAVLILLFALLNVCARANAGTFQFYPEQDVWINETNPEANYGNNTYLNVKDRSGIAETYLRFSDNNLKTLLGQPINQASLNLFQYQYNYSPGDSITLHRITSDWNENTATWQEKPTYDPTPIATVYLDNGNTTWRQWNGLEALVSSWINGGPNYGLALENHSDLKNEELFARFYSSEYSLVANQPRLDVTTTPEPISTLLMGSGLLVMGTARFLKKKSLKISRGEA